MVWPTKKLGEICEIRMGETLIKKDLTGDGIPVYSADSLEKPWGFTSKNKLIFTKGAIIVGARGTLGSVKLPTDEQFTSTQTTIIINPQQEIVSSPFLSYYLRTVDFKKLRGGSGIPMLTVNRLSNLEFPFPPLSEQRKIVNVLDSIQEAVKVQDKIIEKTKELKKSLMHKLFREGTRGAKLKKTEIGEIPENWEVIRFIETLDKKTKFSVGELKQKDYKESGKYPIVDQGSENIAGYSDDEEKVYNGKLPVIIFGDHTRIVKFVNFPFIIGGSGVKILIPKENFDKRFFYYLLSDLKLESRGYNRHFPILKEKHIPFPPLPEQYEIAQILQTIDQKIEVEQKKKMLYEELFKSMLNKLMTGEIRVNNANF